MNHNLEFKYNLNDVISSNIPRETTIEALTNQLKREGLSRATFFRDRSILLTDKRDIPAQRLDTYLKVFNSFRHNDSDPLTLSDLKNYDFEPIDTGLRKP